HQDLAALRVRLLLPAARRGAVHQHPALADQLLGLPPGPPARGRQQLVQPLLTHGTAPPLRSFSPSYHTFEEKKREMTGRSGGLPFPFCPPTGYPAREVRRSRRRRIFRSSFSAGHTR